MIFAHLEAFMIDSIRVICIVEPRKLRRNKTITWDNIIEIGSWEKIIERITEDYCLEFGWKSLEDKILFLKKDLNLEIETTQQEIDTL